MKRKLCISFAAIFFICCLFSACSNSSKESEGVESVTTSTISEEDEDVDESSSEIQASESDANNETSDLANDLMVAEIEEIKEYPEPEIIADLEDGYYYFRSAQDEALSLSVRSDNDIAVLDMAESAENAEQLFYLEKDGDAYQIKSIIADKWIVIPDDGVIFSDINLLEENDSNSTWIFQKQRDCIVAVNKDTRIKLIPTNQKRVFFKWVLIFVSNSDADKLFKAYNEAPGAMQELQDESAIGQGSAVSLESAPPESSPQPTMAPQPTVPPVTPAPAPELATSTTPVPTTTPTPTVMQGESPASAQSVKETKIVHHEEVGHWETRIIQEAYDETIYQHIPLYGQKVVSRCLTCGADFEVYDDFVVHAIETDHGASTTVQMSTGEIIGYDDAHIDHIEHHDAVTEDVWVVDQEAWDEVVEG